MLHMGWRTWSYTLRAQGDETANNLQGLVNALQEKIMELQFKLHESKLVSVRQKIAAWQKDSLEHSVSFWRTYARGRREKKTKVLTILRHKATRLISTALATWTNLVNEDRRHAVVLTRFLAKWQKAGILRVFSGWVYSVAESSGAASVALVVALQKIRAKRQEGPPGDAPASVGKD